MALCHLHMWRPIPPLPLKTVTKPVARPVLWMRTPCLAWNTKTRRTKADVSFLWGSGDRTSVHAPPCSKPGLSVGTPAGFLPLCAPCTAPADKHGVLRKPHQASCHLHPALHPSWQLASGPCSSPLLPMGGDPAVQPCLGCGNFDSVSHLALARLCKGNWGSQWQCSSSTLTSHS